MAHLEGQPMVDAAWLYRAPLYQGSLQWSEDNLIAVAGGPSVTILSPSNLNGPRGHFTIQAAPSPVPMGCQPQDRDASLALKIACLEDASRQVTRGSESYQARPASVRALSWSPMGASSTGGCLLAVLTDDQQVLVYSAPTGSTQAEWQEQAAAQLQQRLLTHMAATKWQDVDVPRPLGDDDPLLRLRGGGSGKRPRGWRKATLPGGAAGTGAGAGAAAATGAGAAAGRGAAAAGAAAGRGAAGRGRTAGAAAGRGAAVAGAAAGRGAAGRGAAGRGAAAGAAAGAAGRGAAGRGAASRGAAKRAAAAAAGGDGDGADEEAAAAGPPGKRRRKNAAQAQQQQQAPQPVAVKEDADMTDAGQPQGLAQSPASGVGVGAVVEVANDEEGLQGAWWRGDVLDIQAGFALVRYQELDAEEGQGAKLQEWFRLPWLISSEEGAAAAPGLQPPAPWHVAEGFRIRPVPPEEACTFPVPPAKDDDLEVDHDDTLWHTRVLGVSPDGAYHVAEPGCIGTALEVTLDQLRPSLRWDWETGAWHRVHPAGAQVPSPAGSGAGQAGPSSRGRGAGRAQGAEEEGGEAGAPATANSKSKKGASKPAPVAPDGEEVWEPEDYVVPADFDMQVFLSLLPGDAVLGRGGYAWKKAGPRLLFLRFTELRQTLEPHQVPVYTKGAHLRNHDLRLFQQALEEFKFCFGSAALQEHAAAASEAGAEGEAAEGRVTEKELIKAAKAAIRQKVVQSFSPYVRQDSTAPYLTKGYTPRGGTKGVTPAKRGTAGASGAASKPAGSAAQGDGRGNEPMASHASLPSELGSATGSHTLGAPVGGEAAHEAPLAGAARGFVLTGRQGVHGAVASLLIEEEGGPALKIDWASSGPKLASLAPLGSVLQGAKVPSAVWEERRRFLMQTSIAWSPCCYLVRPLQQQAASEPSGHLGGSAAASLLAMGTQSGHVVLWRQTNPPSYALQEQQLPGSQWSCLGAAKVTAGRVTCLSWCASPTGPTSSSSIQQVAVACAGSTDVAAGQVAAGAAAGAAGALPGDQLLLAVGSSSGDMKLWVVDPAATTAGAALQCLGILAPPSTRSTPPPLCIDLAVVVDAPAAAGGGASPTARLMVASGSGMGAVSAWTSASFTLGGASRQELAAAIAGGRAAAAQMHAAGKVTGVVVNPWGPGVASAGEDGRVCHSKVVDGRLELQPSPDRFNPHAEPQRTPCPLTYAQRADAPFQGLAASGNRLVLLGVRVFQADGQQVQQQEEGEGQAGGGGSGSSARQNFHRIAKAGLHMAALYGRHPDLQQQLQSTVLPRVLGCSITQLLRADGVLAAAAFWDVAACVISGGWRRLPRQQQEGAPGNQQQLLEGPRDPQQQQQQQGELMLMDVSLPSQGVRREELPDIETEEQQRLERAAQRLRQLRAAEWDMLQELLQLQGRALVAADSGKGKRSTSTSSGSSTSKHTSNGVACHMGPVATAACKLASGLCTALLHLWQSMKCEGAEVPEEQLQQLQSAAEQRQLQLLQQHVARCLGEQQGVCFCLQPPTTTVASTHGMGAAGSSPLTTAAAAEALQANSCKLLQLSQLLLADWAALQGAQLLGPGAQQLLTQSAAVYQQAGAVPAEGREAPAREANPFGGRLPQVRVTGGPVVSAKVAVVPVVSAGGGGRQGDTGAGGTSIILPRCAASGLVCAVDGTVWCCGVCDRRYSAAPVRGAHGLLGVARCLFCGVRLAAGSRGQMAPVALPGPPIVQQQRRTV